MVVGIAIAILICEVKNTKMKKIYQSAILLPFLMSMVILSYIVYALLSAENGLVIIQASFDENKNLKLSSPAHGLAKIPFEKFNFLKASIIPVIGR